MCILVIYTTDLSILFRGDVIKKSAPAPEKAQIARIKPISKL